MTRWSLKATLFGAVVWLVVLIVGLVRGNAVQIVVGAVVTALFLVASAVRYSQRPRRGVEAAGSEQLADRVDRQTGE